MTTASPSVPSVEENLVARLLTDADDFALQALASASPTIKEHKSELPGEPAEQQRIRLRTAFLFPQLPPWQRTLLVTVFWHRQMLSALLKINMNNYPHPLGHSVERMVRQAEAAFMHLRTQAVEIQKQPALSPLQRRAMDLEYLQVHFD
jgi:hypothetical protein